MKDYSAWDDFYISEAVARHCGIDIEETVVFINTGTDSSKHYHQSEWLRKVTDNKRFWKPWNPCNNPADAWPIIMANKISLMFDRSLEDGCNAEWCLASSPCDQIIVDHVMPDKILRSAMIVFLKMKESSHG
jgi:hypothetical protein